MKFSFAKSRKSGIIIVNRGFSKPTKGREEVQSKMRKFAPVLIIIAVIIIAIFVVFACMNIMNNTPKGPDTTVAPSVAP